MLFADVFSVTNKNWDVWNKCKESAVSFLEEGLVMIVDKPDLDIITTNRISYQTVTIETQIRKRFVTSDTTFGVVCRYLNDNNYYGFLIASDGYYMIVIVVYRKYNLLFSKIMEYDERICKEKKENRLHAVCDRATLSLFRDGEEKTRVVDFDLKAGRTRLISGSFAGPGETEVFFDNFMVTVS